MFRFYAFSFCVLTALGNPILTYAHGGGLNGAGCHNNRSTGGYHCHGRSAVRPQVPTPSRVDSFTGNRLYQSFGINSKPTVDDRASLLQRIQQLENENRELRNRIDQPQPEKTAARDHQSALPSIKGWHRNKIRTSYGPPRQVKSVDGYTDWIYQAFRVRISKQNIVMEVYPVQKKPSRSQQLIPSRAKTLKSISIRHLIRSEQESIKSVCSTAKILKGPAAYRNCLASQLKQLASAPRTGGTNHLTTDELSSLQSVCSTAKILKGPAAYRYCINGQLKQLAQTPKARDYRHLPREEQESLRSVCSTDKILKGPAAYRRCINHQLNMLKNM